MNGWKSSALDKHRTNDKNLFELGMAMSHMFHPKSVSILTGKIQIDWGWGWFQVFPDNQRGWRQNY